MQSHQTVRQPVTVTVNQLSNCAKKNLRGKNFITNLKGEVSPAKLSPGEIPPPLYCTCAQAAVSTKCRKKIGSSVAYETIGTFLSQKMGREDASGLATDRCTAVEMQRDAYAIAKR